MRAVALIKAFTVSQYGSERFISRLKGNPGEGTPFVSPGHVDYLEGVTP